MFEGGVVKGAAYGGAVEVLEQSQITPQIERIAGTSAGVALRNYFQVRKYLGRLSLSGDPEQRSYKIRLTSRVTST